MTTTPNLALTQYATTDTINWLTQYNTDMSKIDTTAGKLSNLTTTSKTNLVSAINESVTNIGTLASLKTAFKTSTVGAINEVYDTTDNGWISARATLTYASASAPTFVCNTNIDLTTRISVGMKLKLTQTTTKYFFVTAITSTTITLYGGTDYVLTNAAITDIYYSMVKSPHGFPLNPNKWSVTFVKQTDTVIGSAIANQWYATDSMIVPIGDWNLYTRHSVYSTGGGEYGVVVYTALSSTLGAPSNIGMRGYSGSANAGDTDILFTNVYEENVRLDVSTTFTIILRTLNPSTNLSTKGFGSPTIIKATCAYL